MKDKPQTREMKEERAFRQELTALINKYSKENASDTPDYILAEYMAECLKIFEVAVYQRKDWKE